jgi:mannose-1-phosphate guanylyltransferase
VHDPMIRSSCVTEVPAPHPRGASRHTWAVLLAGGDGTRLMGTSVGGRQIDRPKQFCCFGQDHSLLEATLRRALRLTRAHGILPVVSSQHRNWWMSELRRIPRENVLVQPHNRGTAVAILHGLIHVLRIDSDPMIVVYPSDHAVDAESSLLRALDRALEAAADSPHELVLLGVVPDHPEGQYGWILPEPGGPTRVRRVRAFVEKPSPQVALTLMEQGGLWNSFIFAVSGRGLLELYERAVASLVESYLRSMPKSGWNPHTLADFFASIPHGDFSRDVLERSSGRLRVVPVRDVGWTDLGSPARVEAWLHRRRYRSAGQSTPG